MLVRDRWWSIQTTLGFHLLTSNLPVIVRGWKFPRTFGFQLIKHPSDRIFVGIYGAEDGKFPQNILVSTEL